jgi:hypothetical protein
MKLTKILSEKRTSIINQWFDQIIETYPPDTSKFLKKQKNRFANPVGATISEGMEGLLDVIFQHELDADKASPFLDSIIRIRAVQDFTPSQALAFVFLLKEIIRISTENEVREHRLFDELTEIEKRIDALALKAFDIYMQCREKIYEIKANEAKNMTFRLLQRANLISEKEDQVATPDENNFININTIKRKEVNK